MTEKRLPYQHKSGFKVPENYFGDFETRMLDMLNSEELNGSETSTPFKVPEEYFKSFDDRIIQRFREEKKRTKVIRLITNPFFSYAAGIAAFITVVFSIQFFNQTTSSGYEDLELSAVENYLLETMHPTTPEESPIIKEGDFSFVTPVTADLNHEAVLEYLNENTEDPSLLLNDN